MQKNGDRLFYLSELPQHRRHDKRERVEIATPFGLAMTFIQKMGTVPILFFLKMSTNIS